MPESVTIGGYQVSSTHETPEQMTASFAALDGTPAPETTVEETEQQPETTEQTPDPASDAGKTLAAKKSSLEKRKTSIQSQIDDLTRQKGETQRERDAIKAELDTLKAERDKLKAETAPAPKKEAPAQTPADPNDPEPQEADFESYAEYVKKQARWEARQEFREQQIKQARDSHQRILARAEQARFAAFTDRLEATRKTHAEFDAIIDAGPQLTKPMQDAILDSEIPGELMLHLAEHEDDYKVIVGKHSNLDQYAAMKVLEGRLGAARSSGPAPKVESKSTAPAPIKPVGSTPGAVVSDGPPDPETCTQREYDAYWNKRA